MAEASGRSEIMLDDPRLDGPSDEDAELAAATGSSFSHQPVMLAEVVSSLSDAPSGTVVDCTLGGAGHAAALLVAAPHLRLIGIDRDPVALAAATERLAEFGDRSTVVRARFDQLAQVLDDEGVDEIAGFLFDLGVSSPQLDQADRGFSFRNDGPLDMRMDQTTGRTAADIVNFAEHGEIAGILRRHSDERFAGRIASAIISNRPIESTSRLAEVVVTAIPAAARRKGGHPAKRTFQALRIEVNDELSILRPALETAVERLCVGGIGIVLTYHSGEDRIAKDVIRTNSTVEVVPGLPIPAAEPDFVALRPLARKPSSEELASNRRSTSVRMRGIRRQNNGQVAA